MNVPIIIFWVLVVLLITGAATFSAWWLALFFALAVLAEV